MDEGQNRIPILISSFKPDVVKLPDTQDELKEV